MAKETIFLINSVAQTVNNDPRVDGRLFVAFPPNYNVTLAERHPRLRTSPSRSRSPAREASGTGNMKFALNGASDDRHRRRCQCRDPAARRR